MMGCARCAGTCYPFHEYGKLFFGDGDCFFASLLPMTFVRPVIAIAGKQSHFRREILNRAVFVKNSA